MRLPVDPREAHRHSVREVQVAVLANRADDATRAAP